MKLYAKINEHVLPKKALKRVELMNGKIIISGNAIGTNAAAGVDLIVNSLKKEGGRVTFHVESTKCGMQSTGKIKNIRLAYDPAKNLTDAKYGFEIWL